MEKLTTIIFSIFIALGMTSCAAENQTDETTITTSAAQQSSSAAENSDETSAENEASSGEGKTLVVYYSATNNTEAVAGYIASATGGELYELVPTEPYTSDDLDPFPTIGKIMTRCLSAIPFGGESPLGP